MDARHQFDFIFGSWTVHNRKLADVGDPLCEEWVEFSATSDVYPILDGYGHTERLSAEASGEIAAFEGFTLRLFNPETLTWQIWWSSTRVPGVLDPPVEGQFNDGYGLFECEDTVAGRAVVVRFEWLSTTSDVPRWQQSFSYDARETWKLNWVMDFTRSD
jgi:hypothetical protein